MTSLPHSRRSIVQTQSVQQQFAALTRERDQLKVQMEAADRERTRTETTITELKQAQMALTTELRQAHATLGVESKKKQLLLQEKNRLETVSRKEQGQLHEAQKQLDILQEKQVSEKKVFLQHMHNAQAELEALLNNVEEKRWKRLVALTTAPMAPDAVGLQKATQQLQEAHDKKKHEDEAHHKILDDLQKWRALAEEKQSDVNWKELEQVWQEGDGHDKPFEMNLFYGGNNTTDAKEALEVGQHDVTPRPNRTQM